MTTTGTQLSLTNGAIHLCICNSLSDPLNASPHVCYRVEICHSMLNIGEPKNGERCGSGPLEMGVVDP